MKLSDEDVKLMLQGAFIPPVYRDKSKSLSSYGDRGKHYGSIVSSVSEKVSSGSVMDIVGDDSDTTDLFYLLCRSLVIKGCALACINQDILLTQPFGEYLEEADPSCLAITGLSVYGQADPLAQDRHRIEWALMNWLNNGKGLLLLSDGEITRDERWSPRFRSVILNRLVHKDVCW